jgi:type VI secretion system protein ImpK
MEAGDKTPTELDLVDAVFLNTWLFVLNIKNGHPITVDNAQFKRCCQWIENARTQLSALPQPVVNELLFAQCALIDETIKTLPDTDVSVWYSQPLQSRFFGRIDAGEAIFERIQHLLHNPDPAPERGRMYHRLLLLGFRGKYRDENEEMCLGIMRRLEALPGAAQSCAIPADGVIRVGGADNRRWRSPWVTLAFLVVLNTLLWAGVKMYLFTQYAG